MTDRPPSLLPARRPRPSKRTPAPWATSWSRRGPTSGACTESSWCCPAAPPACRPRRRGPGSGERRGRHTGTARNRAGGRPSRRCRAPTLRSRRSRASSARPSRSSRSCSTCSTSRRHRSPRACRSTETVAEGEGDAPTPCCCGASSRSAPRSEPGGSLSAAQAAGRGTPAAGERCRAGGGRRRCGERSASRRSAVATQLAQVRAALDADNAALPAAQALPDGLRGQIAAARQVGARPGSRGAA